MRARYYAAVCFWLGVGIVGDEEWRAGSQAYEKWDADRAWEAFYQRHPERRVGFRQSETDTEGSICCSGKLTVAGLVCDGTLTNNNTLVLVSRPEELDAAARRVGAKWGTP